MTKFNNHFDFDFSKIIDQFKVVGTGYTPVLETYRKNIEALTKAGQLVTEGLQTIADNQRKMLASAMKDVAQSTRDFIDVKSPQERIARQTAITKEAFEKGVDHLREVSEILLKSTRESMDLINSRVSESLEDLKETLGGEEDAPKKK
jgi:phasin family protein